MRNKSYWSIIFIVGLFLSFSFVSEHTSQFFTIPDYFPKPVYDFSKNPLTQPKIDLGRQLFYEPMLSKDNTISCSSCHLSYSAFTHIDHSLSHGIGDSIGFRNSTVLVNLAWQKHFMWDGAVHHMDVQPLAPIENSVEMGEDLPHVIEKLQASTKYPIMFQKAFGDSIITGEHLLKALAQFQLTFVSANSKYDHMRRGETEFTKQEKKGYQLFQQHCNSCHQEPLFTNGEFANNGLSVDTTLMDFGRYRVTKEAKDSLLFKVPTLRNIEFSFPYMHDGRFKKLSQVMNYYTDEIQSHKTLSHKLQNGMNLTSHEKVDLIAFLLTLSDKEFLFNNNYTYPRK